MPGIPLGCVLENAFLNKALSLSQQRFLDKSKEVVISVKNVQGKLFWNVMGQFYVARKVFYVLLSHGPELHS